MRRILLDLLLGVDASSVPSGSVPGGEAGAQSRRSSLTRGEDEGPICFLVIFPEVLVVIYEDLFALLLSFSVLYVICTPLF
jgi:hypothetical protein